jgi:hypothetical protein
MSVRAAYKRYARRFDDGQMSLIPHCANPSRYASLYFVASIAKTDNELLTLEIIHQFVEILDRYFGNVCELDIIFNFHKVGGRCGGSDAGCLGCWLCVAYTTCRVSSPHQTRTGAGVLHPGRADLGRGAAGDQQAGGAARLRAAGRPHGG